LRKQSPFRPKVLLGIFLTVCSLSGMVFATPAEEAELEQLIQIEQDLELQRECRQFSLYTFLLA
jgi:hypothetical protein